jgi:hypothetical protein
MFKGLVRILRPPYKNAAEDASVMGYNVYFVGVVPDSGVPRNFFGRGGSTNSVEDRENGDLEAVGP